MILLSFGVWCCPTRNSPVYYFIQVIVSRIYTHGKAILSLVRHLPSQMYRESGHKNMRFDLLALALATIACRLAGWLALPLSLSLALRTWALLARLVSPPNAFPTVFHTLARAYFLSFTHKHTHTHTRAFSSMFLSVDSFSMKWNDYALDLNV